MPMLARAQCGLAASQPISLHNLSSGVVWNLQSGSPRVAFAIGSQRHARFYCSSQLASKELQRKCRSSSIFGCGWSTNDFKVSDFKVSKTQCRCQQAQAESPTPSPDQGSELEKERAKLPAVPEWVRRLQKRSQRPVGERITSALLTTSSASIGVYVSEPRTLLHRLDPRVKQAWLLALVLLPARATLQVRLALVAALLLLSVTCLPKRLWKAQLGGVAVLSALLFAGIAIGTEGVAPLLQPRALPPQIEGIPPWPAARQGYRYVLFNFGPIEITRRGFKLAVTATSLTFIVLQSASLCLTTTTPEELVASLRWYMRPLALIGVPVEEIVLSLLLALRFIGLVFDEVRNLALGVVSRGIVWKSLGWLGTVDIFTMLVGRLFKNLFHHADQISQAMVARGFTGKAKEHRTHLLTSFAFKLGDAVAVLLLLLLSWTVVMSQKKLGLY